MTGTAISPPPSMREISSAERRIAIMKVLHERGVATVSKLSDTFGVSEVTIRKDLTELEEQSLLVRTHGGAILHDHFVYDLPRESKANQQAEQKDAIGRAAADLVSDVDSVLLGSGSTTLAVARHLRGKRRLTAATNSLPIASEFANHMDVELLMLGGGVNMATSSVSGYQAERFLRDLSFSWLFLSADGYDTGHGVTTTNMSEARLFRCMTEVALKTVVVADATKFGRRGLSLVTGDNAIDIVISDSRLETHFRTHFMEQGIELILV